MTPAARRGGAALVVVANRLPVDRIDDPAQGLAWQPSPGGLVSALTPMMTERKGTWIGWSGAAAEKLAPFTSDGMRLVPVDLSEDEVELYYEGFSNATIWPLYHDVTAPPVFDRRWWASYVQVNKRFADVAAKETGKGGTVWVQDYQLQLVPAFLRALRPDLRIGFFNHIPFPGYELFARLPWRGQILEGLLGADLIGFQRRQDAFNFQRAARRAGGYTTRGSTIIIGSGPDDEGREVTAAHFPISVDFKSLETLAKHESTTSRARQLRVDLGDPEIMLLGVDRLDYTKGIRHRLQAYGELLEEGRIAPPRVVFVQVASPSREKVGEYQRLRDEVELTVGRINGDFSTLGSPAIHYLHRSFPRSEMAALYTAADIMVVTPLRDGMNLVAKEYVTCRYEDDGALVLSEFTGAADELRQSFHLNPYDIDGTKAALIDAMYADKTDLTKRMKAMRKTVSQSDVYRWATGFLDALADAR